MEKQKFTKAATIIDRILKILQGFSIAGVIVSAIFIPLTLIFGEKIVVNSSKFEIGKVLSFDVNGDSFAFLNQSEIKLSIVVMLVAMIMICLVYYRILKVFREVMAPMKEGNAFAEGISMKIKKLGWVVIIGGTIAECCAAVAQMFQLRAYNWMAILDKNVVSNVQYDFSLDCNYIILGLVILFLSFIFKYGEELQKEADETL